MSKVNRRSTFSRRLALSVSAAALFWNGGALAQDADPDAVADGQGESSIVVTGSRIQRDSMMQPTPTVAVTGETLEAKGLVNVVDALNELPQVSTGYSNANTSFSFGNIGLSQADLRNLGVRRTLTLVNGRRRAGTPDDSNFLAFDLSAIPTALIDRVEVQTGGTSAVYGADAVAGVINIILKDKFDGLEAFANYGLAEGGYYTSSYGVTAGASFDRGSAVFHVSHSENGLLTRADRGLGTRYAFVRNPADTGPSDGIPARIPVRDLKFAYFGIPTLTAYLPFGNAGEYTDVIFDSALQTFRPIDAGPLGVLNGSFSQNEGGTQDRDTLVAPVKRTSIYGKGTYELLPNLKFVAEAIYADINAKDRIGSVFDSFSTFISIDNPYMPDAVRQRLIDNGEDGMYYARQHDEFGMRGTDINRKYYTISAGLEGSFGSSWNWSAVYEVGKSQTTNHQLNDRIDSRWFEASDAILLGGEAVCRSAEARARGCVPVNVFGAGTISPAAVDYIRADHTSTTDTTQQLIQGLISGSLFELPAGPVKLAAGVEFRRDKIDFRPSYVWEQALGFFASQFSPVNKSNDVKEAFAELLVPILKDKPFFRSLEVEGAYRRSDYQRAGSVNSWKLGGTWAPLDDIRFRVTRARAVRAPSLGELFDPGSRGAFGLSDPCDPDLLGAGTANRRANCAALGLDPVTFNPNTRRVTTLVFTTGNENLAVEKGNTLTIGGVFTPTFIPGLSVSADYYRIKLAGGISRIGPQTTLNNCVDLPSLNNQFCDFVTRQADGNIAEVKDSYVNVAGFNVEGIDFEASYRKRLSDIFGGGEKGTLTLRAVASRLLHNVFIDKDLVSGVETAFDNAGEADNPKFRMSLNAAWQKGPLQINWGSRYISGTVTENDLANPQEDVGSFYHIPSLWLHDASLSYDTPMGLRLTAGVRNLFNTGPRDHPNTARGSSAYDDVVGRLVFFGAKIRFGGN